MDLCFRSFSPETSLQLLTMAADKKSASKKAERSSTMNKTSSVKSVATAPKNGAPAQHAQGSRKGKRAWRKNVDIGEVEIGLEEMRAEERVVGCVS